MPFAEDAAKFIHEKATVADNIRALDAAGYPRAEIARLLNKRYQHVRNVLEGDKIKRRSEAQDPVDQHQGFEALADGGLRIGNLLRLPIGPGGAVRLPKAIMDWGYREGGVLLADFEEDRLVIISPKEAHRRIRAMIPAWKPGEPLASEELIAERRREAARDDEEFAASLKGSDG